MGNINPLGKGPQFKSIQDKSREEVKGAASSAETRASSEAASSSAAQQNAEAFRKLLIETFNNKMGNDIADALDQLKKEGKYLTYEVVKAVMEGVFEKHKKSSSEYEKKMESICDLFPHDREVEIPVRKVEEYDPYASAKVITATRRKMRERTEKTLENIAEDEKKRAIEKQKEVKAVDMERILHRKKKV